MEQKRRGAMKNTGIRGRRSSLIIVWIFVIGSIIFANGEISAAPITDLFNTGVNDAGVVLPGGSDELHYQLGLPNPTGSEDVYIIPAINLGDLWVTARPGSAWIGPNSGELSTLAGNYSYILTFDLLGFDSSTAVISGLWASDNSSRILLNGIDTGNFRDRTGFLSMKFFTISTDFLPRSNTLEFIVNNESSGPTGLVVANLAGTAEVPIPGAIWLLGTSLIVLLGIKRGLRS
jgi:hypothetical protein